MGLDTRTLAVLNKNVLYRQCIWDVHVPLENEAEDNSHVYKSLRLAQCNGVLGAGMGLACGG